MNERRRTLLFSSKFVNYPTENGVWIETIEHKYCLPDNWDSEDNASVNSIAVVTDAHKFRVALTDASSSTQKMHSNATDPWDTYLSGTTNSGITTSKKAKTDYRGATNTKLIVTKCQPSAKYAAGMCAAYTFPDGVTKGYLPACGELYLAYQNQAAIDAALAKCGGTALRKRTYWSSTFYGINVNSIRCWYLDWDGGSVYNDPLIYLLAVRSFATLEDSN